MRSIGSVLNKDLSAEEYEVLKKLVGFFYEKIRPENDDSELHPLRVIEEQEVKAPKRAQAGLQMALGDMLEMTSDMPRETVESWDTELQAMDCPSLSLLRLQSYKQFDKLLKRGKIRNLKEYYLMKTFVDRSGEPFDELRQKILDMILEFEKPFGER